MFPLLNQAANSFGSRSVATLQSCRVQSGSHSFPITYYFSKARATPPVVLITKQDSPKSVSDISIWMKMGSEGSVPCSTNSRKLKDQKTTTKTWPSGSSEPTHLPRLICISWDSQIATEEASEDKFLHLMFLAITFEARVPFADCFMLRTTQCIPKFGKIQIALEHNWRLYFEPLVFWQGGTNY